MIWTWTAFVLSLFTSASLGFKFGLLKREYFWWWIPHGVFHILFAYIVVTFISKGFWQLLMGQDGPILWTMWAIVIVLIFTHLRLGAVFPKKLPFEGK